MSETRRHVWEKNKRYAHKIIDEFILKCLKLEIKDVCKRSKKSQVKAEPNIHIYSHHSKCHRKSGVIPSKSPAGNSMGRPSASKSRVSMGLFSLHSPPSPSSAVIKSPLLTEATHPSTQADRTSDVIQRVSQPKKDEENPLNSYMLAKKTFKSSSIAWSHIKSYSPLSLSLSFCWTWVILASARDMPGYIDDFRRYVATDQDRKWSKLLNWNQPPSIS